ncbi:MAG TPA: DUF1850 domain-containing protein [Candidatus Methylomirabilis sp.]|nr:DUF1850 domain-containing protein [Candidatus Methylomirabilis sp.]
MSCRGWLALGIVAVAVGIAVVPVRRLEVVEGRTGRLLYSTKIQPGEGFEIRYVHSVEHFPVIGRFRVEPDDRLRVMETRFARFGAGLPDLMPDVQYERSSGEFRQQDPGVILDALALRVHGFTQHELEQGGRLVRLSSLVPDGGLVHIRVAERRAWELSGVGDFQWH